MTFTLLPSPNFAGWPRPFEAYGEKQLPVPWITDFQAGIRDGERYQKVSWKMFRSEYQQAHHERLCQVCGLKLEDVIVLGISKEPNFTNGSGLHPRCFALAAAHCPHFAVERSPEPAGEQIIAFCYRGEGQGYDLPADALERFPYDDDLPISPEAVPLTRAQAKRLAVANPLGRAADTST